MNAEMKVSFEQFDNNLIIDTSESTLNNKEFMRELITTTDFLQIGKATLNNKTYDITTADDLAVRNAIDSIPKVSFLLSNILIKSGEVLDVGSVGVYEVQGGDTLSEIAQSHSMSTQDLLKLNTWLVDEGRVEFEQDKVLIDSSATNLDNKDHTLEGTAAEDRLIDRNGGADTLKGGKGNDYLEGGTGYDTYIIDGFGENTVFDSDHNGMINFNGKVLDKATDLDGDGIYTDEYNNTYEFDGTDLTISNEDGTTKAIIKEYDKDNSSLGIQLVDAKPESNGEQQTLEITRYEARMIYSWQNPYDENFSDSEALAYYRSLYPDKIIKYVGSNTQ